MLKKFIISFLLIITFKLNLYSYEDLTNINKLLNTYPDYLKSYNNNEIIWFDNSKMIYDDKRIKQTYKEILDFASIKDQMSINYPKVLEKEIYNLKENEDSGRIRNEEFFKKMYGQNEKEIKKNLTKIMWLPKSINKPIWITKINNVDKKLENISNELEKLPNDIKKYLINPGGFNYRKISQSNRLSTHSFGIAIDIDTKYSNYWKWDKKFEYKNQIPLEIVKIFEKYGFIWGGRWYHYDTMHFEYRPELLY